MLAPGSLLTHTPSPLTHPQSRNAYRGLVQVQPGASGARNFSQCDSMLIGDTAGANTYPYIQVGCQLVPGPL